MLEEDTEVLRLDCRRICRKYGGALFFSSLFRIVAGVVDDARKERVASIRERLACCYH